jgi:hypothetical protein
MEISKMATTTATKAGYVLGSDGKIYVEIPMQDHFGFAICDEDQSWQGSFIPFKSWTLLANDDPRISESDRERLGWMLDEHNDEMYKDFSISWEFTGRASADASKAAEAVAFAMVALGVDQVSQDVVDLAARSLGDSWDAKAVEALIANCSFEKIAK